MIARQSSLPYYLCTMASLSTTKGNAGQSRYAKQRRICRILVWVLLVFAAYQAMVAHVLPGFVADIEIDKETGQKRVRKRPERNKKIGKDGQLVHRSPVDGIIEGQMHLVGIHLPDNPLGKNRYYVKGTFCALEWNKQQQDPSRVPLFEDLVRESTLCSVTFHTVDLFEVTQSARKWDLHFRNSTLSNRVHKREQLKYLPQPEAEPIERSIPPTALIFHGSRCGSTLVSNMLASFAPDGSSRVYSEAEPPLKALEACSIEAARDPTLCQNAATHQQLIRDVFYMMGRAQLRGPEHNYVFYKLQPKVVHYIPLLQAALDKMPPWMYLYRDNVHVMQSHFQGSVIDPQSEEHNVLGQRKAPKCLDDYGQPLKQQPKALQTLVTDQQGRTMESLSSEEYCAAYLASLSEAAIEYYNEGQKKASQQMVPHFFINYRQLPDVIWDHVLPSLDIPLRAQDIHRMEKVATKYTQGRKAGKKGSAVFTGDSQHKEKNVPFAIAQASHTFMDVTFYKLEALSRATLQAPSMKDEEESNGQ